MKECVTPLTEEQVWWRPNEASNSIGNLLLHLEGNVRQWLITSFNSKDDARDRPAEFAAPRRHLGCRLARRSAGRHIEEAGQVISRLH